MEKIHRVKKLIANKRISDQIKKVEELLEVQQNNRSRKKNWNKI